MVTLVIAEKYAIPHTKISPLQSDTHGLLRLTRQGVRGGAVRVRQLHL